MTDQSPYRPGMCPFCTRIEAGEYLERRSDVVRFEPLNPVVPGHMLFVPVRHASAADEDPMGAARAVKFAAEYIRDLNCPYRGNANIITSIGHFATQTVMHTHVHVVPRDINDGLHLPWTGQQRESMADRTCQACSLPLTYRDGEWLHVVTLSATGERRLQQHCID